MEISIYKVNYKGLEVALFMSCVGAPSCVAVIEDIFAMGAEKNMKYIDEFTKVLDYHKLKYYIGKVWNI